MVPMLFPHYTDMCIIHLVKGNAQICLPPGWLSSVKRSHLHTSQLPLLQHAQTSLRPGYEERDSMASVDKSRWDILHTCALGFTFCQLETVTVTFTLKHKATNTPGGITITLLITLIFGWLNNIIILPQHVTPSTEIPPMLFFIHFIIFVPHRLHEANTLDWILENI